MPNNGQKLPVSSSRRPRFAPEQEELFRRVLHLLNQRQVPYAVSGAFALREHTGIWRDTKDLDLFLPAEEVSRALEAFSQAGFAYEVTDRVWLAKATAGEYFVDLIAGMSNGVIVVDHSWVERALPASVMGVPARVLAVEELIASKLFVSFRERFDGADIVHLIYGTRGRLDWDRLLALVGEHWGVLLWVLVLFQYVYPAYSDYVPPRVWNELLGRLHREFEHPNPHAPFRGTLLDENMFAIDVNEWGHANLLHEYRARLKDKIRPPEPEAAA